MRLITKERGEKSVFVKARGIKTRVWPTSWFFLRNCSKKRETNTVEEVLSLNITVSNNSDNLTFV